VTRLLCLAFVLVVVVNLSAELPTPANPQVRRVAEYYAAMYALHYHVPIPLVLAIIQRESNWQPCAVSPKGARGLMQLMPATARRLGVRDSCDIEQNISGGVRYLGWLMRLFRNDLRLVAAGYYAGEDIVAPKTTQRPIKPTCSKKEKAEYGVCQQGPSTRSLATEGVTRWVMTLAGLTVESSIGPERRSSWCGPKGINVIAQVTPANENR